MAKGTQKRGTSFPAQKSIQKHCIESKEENRKLTLRLHWVALPKAWTALLTNIKYLTGLLTLDYSLKRSKSAYPLLVLYTDTLEPEGHAALQARKIQTRRVEYLIPTSSVDYSNDPRFYDCWTKMAPFSLTEYDRVVQLDSDMLVLKNMDELFDLPLDSADLGGTGMRVMAAAHACVCNPLDKPHYPIDWTAEACAYTAQHGDPESAQSIATPSTGGLKIMNGGLQVVVPSQGTWDQILAQLSNEAVTATYEFADQSLLSDIFEGRWVALPYVYNALKTLRWEGVHHQIWKDDRVKNIHYILGPKPWDMKPGDDMEESFKWWVKVDKERRERERKVGLVSDGY